jgi:DNA polymerase-3 subunit alpha
MKFLLFDTSANGKPLSYSASSRDSSNWPRLFHLSWQLMNEKGQILDSRNDLIQPKTFSLTAEMEERHKVTMAELKEKGIAVEDSIAAFMNIVPEADMVFAHNLAFNQGVVTAEADRAHIIERLSAADTYCLMQEATYYCGIPGKRGKFKWPSLPELHKRIFNKSYNNASHAEADVNALARCFIVMYKTKVLEDIFDE